MSMAEVAEDRTHTHAHSRRRTDVTSGINRARFISDLKVEEGSERYHEILRSQLSLVDDGQMRGDAQAVRKQVCLRLAVRCRRLSSAPAARGVPSFLPLVGCR